MKRMVRAALRVRASRAPLIAARTSAVPELTAESCTSRAPVSAAMSRASVVLPLPGGPKKIMLNSWPPSTAARSTVPGPTMCSCPANSASVRGRMRAASGASAATCSSLIEKRSMPVTTSVTPHAHALLLLSRRCARCSSEHHLRAAQRVFGAARPRAPAQGQGRGARAVRRRCTSERGAYEIPLVIRLQPTSASRAAAPRRASRGAPSSPATGTAASTAAAPGTSPWTTSCRAPGAAPTRGTTSSPRARPATARRATGRCTWPGCASRARRGRRGRRPSSSPRGPRPRELAALPQLRLLTLTSGAAPLVLYSAA